jgi:hypothetical protein
VRSAHSVYLLKHNSLPLVDRERFPVHTSPCTLHLLVVEREAVAVVEIGVDTGRGTLCVLG